MPPDAPRIRRAPTKPPRLLIALLFVAVTAGGATHAGYSFPPEWAPHEAVWLGWADDARQQRVQVEMIRAMAPHVAIRLMVSSEQVGVQARTALDGAGVATERVRLVVHPGANVWIRDAGPRFLSDGRRLAVAEFAWNAYGYPRELLVDAPELLRRGDVAKDLAARLSLPRVSSSVVAEGGALDVSDTVILAYRQTALQRNLGVPLATIEREYLRVHGKRKVVWLGRAPLSDRVFSGPKVANYFGAGANGHVDEYVRFVDNATIVIAQVDPEDARSNPVSRADDTILRENLAELRAAVNTDGRPFRIVTLPVPALRHHLWTGPLRERMKRHDAFDAWYRGFEAGDEIHWVPAVSYLNFFVTNGVVLVPAYWREGLPEREREKDALVHETLQRLFPGRRIVPIDVRELNRIGGGMHCITQQQPRVP